MSRSFALERIRINVEIFIESIGDFLAGSFGSLRKPLMAMVGMALVMTLRSARKGVQRMKMGGLTAGGHHTTYKATAYAKSSSTLYKPPSTTGLKGSTGGSTFPGSSSSYTPGGTTPGTYGGSTSTYGNTGANAGYASSSYGGNSGASSYGTTGTNGYGGSNAGTSTYGSASGTSTYTGGASTYGAGASPYGSSTSTYGGAAGGVSGSMASGQPSRALTDLIDQHGAAIRVMDAHAFKDYGGVHDFYGQVETLQAFEGAGVVEKVLQSPGMNKVLVVDGGGNLNVAIFGRIAAANAKQNGWRGVIIHGAIRDAKHIGETAIGCKAMASNPNRGRATSGSKGTPLNIAGMPISTGMWIYADKDGIALSDTELQTQGSIGGTVSGYTPPGSNVGYGSTGGYQGANQPGGYGSQTGATNTGYTAGSYGSTGGTAGGYGSTGTYGSSGSTTGGYGSTGSTYGSQGTYGTTTPGYGASGATQTIGGTGRAGSATYPYSHATTRSGVYDVNGDVTTSTIVFATLVTVFLVPFELI